MNEACGNYRIPFQLLWAIGIGHSTVVLNIFKYCVHHLLLVNGVTQCCITYLPAINNR